MTIFVLALLHWDGESFAKCLTPSGPLGGQSRTPEVDVIYKELEAFVCLETGMIPSTLDEIEL